MKWEALLRLLGREALFHSSVLLAGRESAAAIRRQLLRWVASGRLIRLRRGLYAVAPPYRQTEPHPFAVANRLKPASYVSLQSALSHYGLIPEHVPVVTSVSTGRPEVLDTPLGVFDFRHVARRLFCGYRVADLGEGGRVFLASPEKALLDLVHLSPGGDSPGYLEGLRLQNLQDVDPQALAELADRCGSAKLARAARSLGQRIAAESAV